MRWFNLNTGIIILVIIIILFAIGMGIVGYSLWNVPKAKELFPFLEISEVFPTKAIALFTGLATFGTLVLALTTILTIKNNNEREKRRREDELDKEKRDRKERLLNEIIEWANGILACCFTIEEPVITEDISSLEVESRKAIGERIRRASFTNMLQRYQAISVKFESMIGIASIFDENLGQNIRTVNQNLSNEINILVQFIGDKSKAEEFGKTTETLLNSANNLVKVASKIKISSLK